MHFIQWAWQLQPNWIIEHQTKKGKVSMTVKKLSHSGFILIGGCYALYTVGMAIATEIDYRRTIDKLQKENDSLLSGTR